MATPKWRWGSGAMNDLIPTFGIDGYSQRLVWALESSTQQVALVEAASIGALGIAAGLLLILALFRRSAVAAVGFSFVALSALMVAMIFGKLSFVSPGTQVLIVCLFTCSVLLFLTATIRMARDNSMIGIGVLIGLALMLGAGVASMVQAIDGWPVARMAIGVTVVATMFFLVVEFFRGDKGTIAVAPGLLLLVATLPAMSFAADRPIEAGWMMTVLPVALMTGGVLLAAIAAQLTASVVPAPAPKRKKTPKRKIPVAPAATVAMASAGAPLLRDMDDHEDDHHDERAAPMFDDPAPAFEELVDDEPDDMPPFFEDDEEEAPAPQPARRPMPALDQLDNHPPHHEEERRPASQVGFDAHQPTSSKDRFGERSDPYSAQWGGAAASGYTRREIPIADDEYVWDMMADREVRMGGDFAEAFSLGHGVLATPDVVRDYVDERSLPDYDDAILGGFEPKTGRFDVDLQTANGSFIRLEGRRQVDPDGLMSRLELRMSRLGAAAPVAAPIAQAPEPPVREEPQHPVKRAAGLAAVAAPAREEKPAEEAPLSAMSTGPVAALDRGEIGPWFQPIVRLNDRKTVGFEALARWELPNGDVRDAHQFVDELIEAGRGLDLARVIIDRAAAELAAWLEAEPTLGQFVSVNISATDLPKEEVADMVEQAVNRHNLPAGPLVVELTEGKIQSSQSKALASAKAIRKAGASLAVDDFGVGYSTLSRLSKFRFDIVKLDKSLIADLTEKKKQRSVVRAMLTTAAKASAPVVAEGIEDEETAQLLAELGCDFGQGYLFGAAQRIGGEDEVPPEPAPQTELAAPTRAGDQDLAAPPRRGPGSRSDLR